MAVTEFASDSRFQTIADRLTSIERIEAMICLSAAALILLSIPFLVNIVLCLATSQKRSLLDFAAGEIAIDKKTSVILDE